MLIRKGAQTCLKLAPHPRERVVWLLQLGQEGIPRQRAFRLVDLGRSHQHVQQRIVGQTRRRQPGGLSAPAQSQRSAQNVSQFGSKDGIR